MKSEHSYKMSLKTFLRTICVLASVDIAISSYVGTEESLRQNIADLLDGKLKLSGLPYEKDELSDTTPKNHSQYDFIVIGAGSAGATVTSRLTEMKNATVLLIEAGGNEYSILDIPALGVAFQTHEEVIWNYQAESSDKACLGKKDRKCNMPRGKVMGGSSTINSFVATRGDRRDYDGWANATGDDSWSYVNMLKYLKKLENFQAEIVQGSEERSHGVGGSLPITSASRHPEISKSFVEAREEMGFSEMNYDRPEQVGFTHSRAYMTNGEGWSCNRAYLRPAKGRKNLIVTQNSHVHKILIDQKTKRAYGVRYSKNGRVYEVRANKEIILSAGVFNSPQILMLSGIGPQKHLNELNIDVIKDSPAVGEHLQDHIRYERGLLYTVNDSSTVEVPNVLDPKDTSVKDYIENKNGPLAYGSNLQAMLLLNVDDRELNPNVEILLTPGPIRISKETVTPTETPLRTYVIHPILMRSHSRGKVLLRSNNPFDKPRIFANYLEDPDDVRVLIKGIRLAKRITETDALKRHGSELQEFTSDCDVYGKDTDEFWECEIRMHTVSAYHSLGTCRMGRDDSTNAVVDSKLKVIGINGLRVVDASVMPNNVCVHVNTAVIAIAEKAADLIKMEHGY